MDTGANLDDAAFSEGLPALAPGDRDRLLKHILKGVSRAFYLTLRILPGGLREPVGLAYLLARAADTIADTRALAPDERLARLLEFRAQVEGPACLEVLTSIGAAVDERATLSERELLASLPNAFSMLESLPEPDQARVRSVVVTLTRGMEMDLTIFPSEASGQVGTLKTAEELDRYTYLVAGCVGEFW
ncbi:MAG: squalene/phytoene synthase family protein, partial [Chloroflexi bacterium]|nr:squalene/phytoene synthase family protein [Chloroflexota bacterium]